MSRLTGLPVYLSEHALEEGPPRLAFGRPLWRRLLEGRTADVMSTQVPAMYKLGGALVVHPALWDRTSITAEDVRNMYHALEGRTIWRTL